MKKQERVKQKIKELSETREETLKRRALIKARRYLTMAILSLYEAEPYEEERGFKMYINLIRKQFKSHRVLMDDIFFTTGNYSDCEGQELVVNDILQGVSKERLQKELLKYAK